MRNADVARATEDLNRRAAARAARAPCRGEELQHARDALTRRAGGAGRRAAGARGEPARTDRTTVASHPDVLAAAAQVRDAYLDVARTAAAGAGSGYVAKRTVQLGQRVAPGAPLMAIVPLDQVWVDANFKEAAARDDAHRPAGRR